MSNVCRTAVSFIHLASEWEAENLIRNKLSFYFPASSTWIVWPNYACPHSHCFVIVPNESLWPFCGKYYHYQAHHYLSFYTRCLVWKYLYCLICFNNFIYLSFQTELVILSSLSLHIYLYTSPSSFSPSSLALILMCLLHCSKRAHWWVRRLVRASATGWECRVSHGFLRTSATHTSPCCKYCPYW